MHESLNYNGKVNYMHCYTLEIEDLFTAHSMDAMIYADDTQFYIALKDTNT